MTTLILYLRKYNWCNRVDGQVFQQLFSFHEWQLSELRGNASIVDQQI